MTTELFKGFVPVRDKKCTMPFKDKKASDLLTLEQAQRQGDFAGILANNTILIDIDNEEQSEIMMDIVEDMQLACRVYKTTRGMHFLFLNDGKVPSSGTSLKLACGLNADIKVGAKNSYEVLRHESIDREIIYDIFDDEEYERIPFWAIPIKTKVELLDLKEGDGRNQSLFNYILTLQGYGLSKDEVRRTLEIANKYVLAEPLEEKELAVIMRDEAFQQQAFYKGNQFLFDKFAQYLKNEHHIKRINGQLHMYQEGVYIDGYRALESAMVGHIATLSQSKRREVLSYLELICPKNQSEASANMIAFENGIYDIETGAFIDFSPDVVVTNKISWNYNANANHEAVERVLQNVSCHDREIRDLLEETVGYCMYRRSELRKAFILIGDKHNGKSTFLDMIVNLLGSHNTCALDLSELGERFKTAELFNKLANIGDDIGDEFIPNPAIFKKLCSGDPVNVERKGQDPFDFSNYAKLLFSANNMPRIKDKTGAVLDRLVIIPFEAKFTADDPDFDPHIKYKLRSPEAMEYLIQLGLSGLKRLLENKRFTVSEQVQEQLEEYSKTNNPILFFFQDHTEDDFLNQPTKYAFRKYQEFCINNEYKAMSANEFSKQIKKYYDLEIIDKRWKGEKHRVFTKAKF